MMERRDGKWKEKSCGVIEVLKQNGKNERGREEERTREIKVAVISSPRSSDTGIVIKRMK